MQPIKAKRVVMLTGTPIANRPKELHPLAKRLDPATFGDFMSFAKRYCGAHHNGWGWDFDGATNLEELQTKLRSTIMVRRLKADVLTELPAKIRQVIVLPTNGAAGAVAAERKAMDAQAKKLAVLRARAELARAAGDKKAYAKAVAALRGASQAAFEETSKLRRETAVAKAPAAIEHVTGLLEGGVDKVLVFAHHREVVDLLMQGLAEYGPVKIMGGDSMADRQGAVDRFQNDAACRVFVGSIQAAGVGLTLTAGSTVVFAELDWVPGNITQAEDRAHRIGQRDTVLVQHLVLDGSIDARLAHTLVRKQEIIDRALDDETGEVVAEDNAEAVEAAEAALLEARERAEADLAAAKLAAERNKDCGNKNREALVEVARAQTALERLEAKLAKRESTLEERPASSRVSAKRIAEMAEKITPEQAKAVHQAMRLLAGMDTDRARDKNDAGFNKADGALGHLLAEMVVLSPRQAVLGRIIAKTYRRQIGEELLTAMGAP